MARFWLALGVPLFFYARMDILIWQRIFEANRLIELGIGTYHWGWVHALFGFMTLGMMIFYPKLRRMITYPLSLALLAFSGLEDILYYWLDGRSLPNQLPWLNANPFIIKPVTPTTLIITVLFWILVVVMVDVIGSRCETWVKSRIAHMENLQLPGWNQMSPFRKLLNALVGAEAG